LPKSFAIVCSPRTTKLIEFIIMHVFASQIVF